MMNFVLKCHSISSRRRAQLNESCVFYSNYQHQQQQQCIECWNATVYSFRLLLLLQSRSTYKIVKWLNCMRAHQSMLLLLLSLCVKGAFAHFTYDGMWFAHDLWYKCEPCQFINGSSSLSRQPVMCALNIHMYIWISAYISVWALHIKRRRMMRSPSSKSNQMLHFAVTVVQCPVCVLFWEVCI